VERSDRFELVLAQTAIAEFQYKSDGSLELTWQKPAGSEPVSLLDLDSLDTMIVAYHNAGNPSTDLSFNSIMVASGNNFDTSLSGLRVEYPDQGFFEFDGGFSRNINNIEVETVETYLLVSRAGYNAKGTYSMSMSDSNGVESSLSDECYFGFDADSGAATFVTTPVYAGGNDIVAADYDKSSSDSAGCYIVYNVERADGTNIGDGSIPAVIEEPSAAVDLTMSGIPAGASDSYVVIATIDTDISQTELDEVFLLGTSDLDPEKLPGWLYNNFGDRINFVGISVMEYSYP
jgi:hypothetical protein